MKEVDLRNVLEYDIEVAYGIFKPLHENLCYSEIDSSWEVPSKPIFADFNAFKNSLEETNIFFIVLKEKEERVIGYIILDVFNSGVAQIRQITIKSEERRYGYGRRAVKELIEGLKEDEDLKALTVISATMATDSFYSSCGFRYISGDTYERRLRD